VEIFQRRRQLDAALGIGVIAQGIGHLRSTSIDERRMDPRQRQAKCGISEDLRNICRAACLAFAVSPDGRPLSELLDGWSPQHSLGETMITMVTYFRSKVVKFIFGGRNSGQNEQKERETTPIHEGVERMGYVAITTSHLRGMAGFVNLLRARHFATSN
jgi:hypothetical protein